MKVAARKDMRIQHLGPMIARSVVVFGMTFVAALAVIFDDFSTFWTNVSQLTYLMCGVIIIWLGYGYYFKKLRG